jgi:hypothetical protein
MESVVKQGTEFLKREGRRVENLLKGKVNCKLNDDTRHANAEGALLKFL